jgi:hypothetical protein
MAADHLLDDHEPSCPGDYTFQQHILAENSALSMLGCSDEVDIEARHSRGMASLCVPVHENLDSGDDFMRTLSKFGAKLDGFWK